MTQKNRHDRVPYTPMNMFDLEGFKHDLLERVKSLSIADTKAHQQYLDYRKANDEFDLFKGSNQADITKRLKEINSLSDGVILAFNERDKLRDDFMKHLRLNADLTLTMLEEVKS